MKNIFINFIILFFGGLIIACSSGASDIPNPDISGCMDDCAVNYNADATIEDNSCMYDILGVYTIDALYEDGVDMSSLFVNTYYEFDVTNNSGAVWSLYSETIDGSIIEDGGVFTHTDTTITLISDIDGAQTVFTITNLNCLELDGYEVEDNIIYSFESTFVNDIPISGCMDDCAVNYNADATIEDNSCMYDILGTYNIDVFLVDGEDQFDATLFENPYVSAYFEFDVTNNSGPVWSFYSETLDGTIVTNGGVFTNTDNTITLTSYEDDEVSETIFTITKLNCVELDAYGTDEDGDFVSFELTFDENL